MKIAAVASLKGAEVKCKGGDNYSSSSSSQEEEMMGKVEDDEAGLCHSSPCLRQRTMKRLTKIDNRKEGLT